MKTAFQRHLLSALVIALVCAAAAGGRLAHAGPAAQTQPTATPTATATAGADWARIQAAGKLKVGTAADYVPFSFFTANFMIDGYDISLMRTIGQRLKLQTEFQDIPFDNLLAALENGEIDVAIAALSVTPERSQRLDFTRPYYVGEDAILARQDAAIGQIRQPADMLSLRIGVQDGSVYQTWVQDQLIDGGQMPASQLQRYPDTRRAIFELKNGGVDLVILDALPAQDQVRQGGVKIVGGNLARQSFAIAVRKGNSVLLEQLDLTLSQLQEDNYMTKLAGQYLALKSTQVLPLPTSTPPPPPANGATPPPPLILGLFANADVAAVGTCVVVRWTVSPAVTSLRLFRNGTPVVETPTSSQYRDCPSISGAVEYRLEASDGQTTQSVKASITFVNNQPF